MMACYPILYINDDVWYNDDLRLNDDVWNIDAL